MITREIDVIVDTPWSEERDEFLFFSTEGKALHVPVDTDMLTLLVQVGLFSSKSEVRRNWKHRFDIPWGYSSFTVGKLKNKLTILKAMMVP